MADAVDWQLITRYLSHTCSAQERQAVQAWVAASAENAAALEEARVVWDASAAAAPVDWDAPREWDALRARLHSAHPRRIRVLSQGAASALWARARWPAIAATLAAVLVAAALAVGIRYVAATTYETGAGGHRLVTLSDGTQVLLAPASHLRVPVDYATGSRSVTLDGEAFFTVMHDATHPFSVRTRRAVATDIGTRFDVRAYGDDRDVQVAVVEGRVGIDVGGEGAGPRRRPHNSNKETLSAGDIATVTDTIVAITHAADVDGLTAWTHGELRFRDTPLPQALADLARWYDLDIRLEDPALTTRRLTATFTTEPTSSVIATVAAALAVPARQQGRLVILGSR